MTCEGCDILNECDKTEWCNKLTQRERNILSSIVNGYLEGEK